MYARHVSGIDIHGNAWRWWHLAAGHYPRGHHPKVGAAIVFKRLGHMPLGHVAVVRQVLGDREIKVDQANWAPNGSRLSGKVQHDIKVIDVSRRNDWSSVRVWYRPTRRLGSVYPVYGFIYAHPLRRDVI